MFDEYLYYLDMDIFNVIYTFPVFSILHNILPQV